MLTQRTVLVAGSKEPSGEDAAAIRDFAEHLGAHLVAVPGWRLLTGGADRAVAPGVSSVDYHVAHGACTALPQGETPESKILTLHPRYTRPGLQLHTCGTVIRTRGNTREAGRYELVDRADAIITVQGTSGTWQFIEHGVAVDKPVLPVPCTGGQSAQAWAEDKYRAQLLARLAPRPKELEMLERGLATPQPLADTVVSILQRLLLPTCFVMMPLRAQHSQALYEKCLEPLLASLGYSPVRADRVHGSQSVLEDIVELVRASALIIADATAANANVMYELGYAHALGKPVIIICKAPGRGSLGEKLPFDIRTMRVVPFDLHRQGEFEKMMREAIKSYKITA